MRHLTSVSLAVTAALALAGCGGGGTSADADGDGTITGQEMATAAKGMVKPLPGKYETKVTVLDMQMPEVPGMSAEQMRSMMSSSMNHTSTSCVTSEDAENFAKNMAQTSNEGDCTFSKFDVSGGDIDAQMACKGDPGSGSMHLTGTIGPEQSRMVMEFEQTTPNAPPGGPVKMKLQMDSHRIGDCD